MREVETDFNGWNLQSLNLYKIRTELSFPMLPHCKWIFLLEKKLIPPLSLIRRGEDVIYGGNLLYILVFVFGGRELIPAFVEHEEDAPQLLIQSNGYRD